jgi:REP element-mobilizing transposase RayT
MDKSLPNLERVARINLTLFLTPMLALKVSTWPGFLMPGHLHCIWTLPAGDADFATRWNLIKRRNSQALKESHFSAGLMTASKSSRRVLTFWQRRYWEHRIRDELRRCATVFVAHADNGTDMKMVLCQQCPWNEWPLAPGKGAHDETMRTGLARYRGRRVPPVRRVLQAQG